MAKYVIDIDGENVIVDGRLHIPIEVSLGKGTKKPVRVDIVLDNNVTPYAELEAYNEGFQAGSANTSLVITDNTIRERIEEAYQRGYDDAKHEFQDCQKIMMDAEQERVDKAYQQGVSDAENRRATCEFCEYRFLDEDEEPCRKCACNYLNKFRPKKEKIQIGDEVRSIERGWTAIVTRLKEGYLTLMDNNGEIANGYVENMFAKTGRHFPEIAEVLQKMNEDDG